MPRALVSNQSFESRHYEAVKRCALAPIIGNLALQPDTELDELRARRRVEIADILAEGLRPEKPDTPRGAISTYRQFEAVEGKIVAQDGEIIEELLIRALQADIELADQDPFFAPFLPARTRHELNEHLDNESCARGETEYNTQVVFSPYSEEFDDGTKPVRKKLVRAAQKPYYKRAMIRLSHWDGERLHLFTRSVDNASVRLLKEAAKRQFDYEFTAQSSTDMLGERLRLRIDDDSWLSLADEIVGKADTILAERQGGKWRQGIKQELHQQALEYVESQTGILDPLIAIGERLAIQHGSFEIYQAVFREKIFDAIALLEKRLESGADGEAIIDYESAASGAGALARAEGKSYDACGLVIDAENQNTVANQTGFESLARLLNKKIHCPECSKEVKVPKADLAEGKLTCSECGYWVEVCSGRKGFAKRSAEKVKTKAVSGLEIIAGWFRKEKHNSQIKKAAERQAKAELGNNVTYLDIMRYERQLRNQLGRKPR